MREDAIRISFRHEDFRVSFWKTLIPVAGVATIASELYLIVSGQVSVPVLMIVVPIVVTLLCALAVTGICLRYKFAVGPEGIECFDIWLRPCRTDWTAVKGTRFVRVCGLDYLLVAVVDQKRAIWIPLFVTRYHLLRDLLITYADASHHLDEILERAA